MVCPKCNHPIEADTKICPVCGKTLLHSPGSRVLAIAGIAALIAINIVIIGYIYWKVSF